jgi:hypothetical protein
LETVLVFDNTENIDSYPIEGKINFNVTAARPYYNSSDDALVDWVKGETFK